jgi:hypothetical protein
MRREHKVLGFKVMWEEGEGEPARVPSLSLLGPQHTYSITLVPTALVRVSGEDVTDDVSGEDISPTKP